MIISVTTAHIHGVNNVLIHVHTHAHTHTHVSMKYFHWLPVCNTTNNNLIRILPSTNIIAIGIGHYDIGIGQVFVFVLCGFQVSLTISNITITIQSQAIIICI